jgi:hypothetical protein
LVSQIAVWAVQITAICHKAHNSKPGLCWAMQHLLAHLTHDFEGEDQWGDELIGWGLCLLMTIC